MKNIISDCNLNCYIERHFLALYKIYNYIFYLFNKYLFSVNKYYISSIIIQTIIY